MKRFAAVWLVLVGVGACGSSGSSSGREVQSADEQDGAGGTDGGATDGAATDGTDGAATDGTATDGTATDGTATDGTDGGAPGASPSQPGLIGPEGMAAWDGLDGASKESLRAVPILYLHQSVGQDLEDGCDANSFKFEYFGPGQTTIVAGLNGGIFTDVGNVPNGEPMQKMQVVRDVFAAVKDQVRVFSFSFGYADVRDEDLAAVQTEYQKLVGEVKAAGVRFLHVTPPIVFSAAENPPKMAMRTWMIDTFTDDVVFDLQDIESLDGGARCEEGGVWHICQANRSTESCPSKGQGIDGDGAGHLCETKAAEFSKALLFAYYRASR
jgi:hypothetical protein